MLARTLAAGGAASGPLLPRSINGRTNRGRFFRALMAHAHSPGLRRLSKRGTTRYFQFSGLSALIHHRRVQLALSIRVTIAALVALTLAQSLQLPLPLWVVLTAVIVTQMSVGRSLKTTFDYLVGTLGGAIYGPAIGLLIPHSNEIALLAVLAIAVAPLALLAAINPRLSVAPITAIIVLLVHPRKSDRFGP
jgi:uncharacterized membrane protein YccC